MKKKANRSEKYSYVTLLSSDNFLPGVILLNWSLKSVGAHYPLYVLCSDSVSEKTILRLKQWKLAFQKLKEHIPISDRINLEDGYDHWNRTFDKLYIWTLTQFDKIVYLDSDMQVIANIDHLFDCSHMSAVRADAFNEPGLDKLNSGLMVIVPNMGEFEGMCTLLKANTIQLKRMGDQDVIRAYFRDWGAYPELTLSPGYNVLYSQVTSGVIQKVDVSPVSVIHYIGSRKPWMVSPRAIFRRSRNNFLGKYLLKYAWALYRFYPLHFLRQNNLYYCS